MNKEEAVEEVRGVLEASLGSLLHPMYISKLAGRIVERLLEKHDINNPAGPGSVGVCGDD